MAGPVSKTISIVDKDFSSGSQTKKILSIELGLDGFSFTILDVLEFKYQVLESYQWTEGSSWENICGLLESIIKANPVLTENFERVNIAYFSPQLNLVPFEVFQHLHKDAYHDFVAATPPAHDVITDRLNNLKAYGVYSFPGVLQKKLNYYFPSHRIRHSGSVLIESLLAAAKLREWEADIVLQIRPDHVEIILMDKQQLIFYNAFRYQTLDDLMYYLFFVLEKFNLEASGMRAMLIGEVSLDSELYRMLSAYFRESGFMPRSDFYKYSREFESIPHHFFYNLLNLNSCG